MDPEQKGALLTRLGKDTAGNTLAIMAAAFFPLAGLIGGGVDMTRIYITKTRLQQACDAGALSGRKTMGAGSWTTSGTNSSRAHAYQLFAANFQSGNFGSEALSREFTERDGTVSGTASVDVPMTLMRIFGQTTRKVSVTCKAEMEIPNTDVMFVLDVTYSMAGSRMTGLKSAVKCFYEALLKVNTSEVCGGDPTNSSYTGTAQIRLGFVPYAVNVNVGKLLPNNYMSNNWSYQSREANSTIVHTWEPTGPAVTPAGGSYGSWSGGPASAASDDTQFTSWAVVSGADSDTFVMQSGGTYRKKYNTSPVPNSSTSCDALNTYGSQDEIVGMQWTDGTTGTPTFTEGAAPNWVSAGNPANQTMNASRSRTETITYGYRYVWEKNGQSSNACWLERGTKSSSNKTFTQTQNATTTRPIAWTDYPEFTNWTYKQRTNIDVSGLKGGGGFSNPLWNTSVSIPRAGTTTMSLKRSGSTSSTNITVVTDGTVDWNGCIEERPTFQNTDGTPAGEWDPIPSAALDMNINHVPSAATPAEAWGPMLPDAVWGRYTGSSTRTTSSVTTASDLNRNLSSWCPNPSRKLAEYNTLGDLETYINSLDPVSLGTYHDIGMLWGARLLSPTGIFGSENALTSKGGAIERHMIFMTDGNAQTVVDNLYAYGLPWWDRRQTSYAPTTGNLDALVNERLPALCTAVKNMNIKLWVISYGGGVDAANEARLAACASPGQYYSASDGTALISRFKQIASEIADLRLTQ